MGVSTFLCEGELKTIALEIHAWAAAVHLLNLMHLYWVLVLVEEGDAFC